MIKKDDDTISKYTIAAAPSSSQYSILIKGLPPNSTEEYIIDAINPQQSACVSIGYKLGTYFELLRHYKNQQIMQRLLAAQCRFQPVFCLFSRWRISINSISPKQAKSG
jgi:hypothetical protein